MVYAIQDYWVFGLCPSSGILKTQKNTTFRKLDLFPSECILMLSFSSICITFNFFQRSFYLISSLNAIDSVHAT
jgi:hypothetical protein